LIVAGFYNLKNLEYLDLSYNTLNNSIFQAIGTMTSLKTLYLWSCSINGEIPTAQGKVNDSYSLLGYAFSIKHPEFKFF
jgi:Leucine-rich repeat (LRR) protein